MNEMTAGEIAERLEQVSTCRIEYSTNEFRFICDPNLFLFAASILRRVASGELAEVVRAHWIDDGRGHYCSNCKGYITNSQWTVFKNPHCPSCGALMDGKDDSHEAD